MLTRKEIIKALQNYSEEIGGKTPGEKNFYENTSVGIMDRKRSFKLQVRKRVSSGRWL